MMDRFREDLIMTSCKRRALTITIIAVLCLLAMETAVFANGAGKNVKKIKNHGIFLLCVK